jgi:protein-S-isoprenylcysteine O-methyltransferase Ste14
MRRFWASLGSLVFFIAAPGTVLGLVPWSLTKWQFEPAFWNVPQSRWIGAALVAAGLIPLVSAFVRFAWDGLGTPAPIAPTKHLVVTGLYRRVRNPMYLALLIVLVGEALLFADIRVAIWGLLAWIASFVFVVVYEEPTLHKTFGAEYETYCANVPRWRPRLMPWRAG